MTGSGATAEALADALRTQISEGHFAPGEKLRQHELATRFGTSRIPVREALRTLQAEGLVTYSPNRGAVVTLVSPREIQEMLEVRIALECHAIRLAVPNIVEPDIAAMRRILEDYDRSPSAAEWSSMNWRFHWALYLPCDCQRLLDAIDRNFKHFNSAARTRISEVSGKERPQREHYKLLALAEKGRAEEAASLLRDHIRDTQRSIRAGSREQRRAGS